MQEATMDALVSRLTEKMPSFPTSAQAALRVLDAINDPNCTVASAAQRVQLEPMLSARAVAMSNTVAYNRSGRPVTSIQDALQLIGLQTLRMLAVNVAMGKMSASSVPAHQAIAARLWDHSMQVGAIAHVLARHTPSLKHQADAAMFAGTVHELSGFYLLMLLPADAGNDLPRAVRMLLNPGGEDAQSSTSVHPLAERFARPLLTAMRIPTPIIEAIQSTWYESFSLPAETLGDTLMLADALSPVRSPFEGSPLIGQPIDRSLLDQFADKNELDAVLAESQQTIQSLVDALKG